MYDILVGDKYCRNIRVNSIITPPRPTQSSLAHFLLTFFYLTLTLFQIVVHLSEKCVMCLVLRARGSQPRTLLLSYLYAQFTVI